MGQAVSGGFRRRDRNPASLRSQRLRSVALAGSASALKSKGVTLTNLPWRAPETAAERAVEIGQIVESRCVRDLTDEQMVEPPAEQLGPRALQPLFADEFSETRPLAFEEHSDIARAQPVPAGDVTERELALQVFQDGGLERLQPRHAYAAMLGDLLGLSAGAKRESGKVINVRNGQRLESQRAQIAAGVQRTQVTSKEPECRRVARDTQATGLPHILQFRHERALRKLQCRDGSRSQRGHAPRVRTRQGDRVAGVQRGFPAELLRESLAAETED